MTPEIAAQLQSLEQEAKVYLYQLDLTKIGVPQILYFAPHTLEGSPLVFGGNTYTYASVTLTGLKISADGTPSNPKLFITNVTKLAASLVTQYQDLVGARVTRIVTFKNFLDGQSQADPNATLRTDVFKVVMKRNMNPIYGEFAVRPMHSLEGRKLPGRLCMKKICSARYRTANNGGFDYNDATCPYTDAGMYSQDGTPVQSVALDDCPHNLQGCATRYGEDAVLPIHAFPAMDQ